MREKDELLSVVSSQGPKRLYLHNVDLAIWHCAGCGWVCTMSARE